MRALWLTLALAALAGCDGPFMGDRCRAMPDIAPAQGLISPAQGAEAPQNATLWIRVFELAQDVVLRGPDGRTVVPLTVLPTLTLSDSSRIARRRPSQRLAPGGYTVELALNNDQAQPVGGFGVGTKVDALPPGKMEIEEASFTADGSGNCFSGDSMTFKLSRATDDVTPPERLLHEVFVAAEPGRQDLENPTWLMGPGERAFFDFGSLFVGEESFVKVRAVDEAGNEGAFGEEWRVLTPHDQGMNCATGGVSGLWAVLAACAALRRRRK